jgi:hypothetical protein
MENNNTTSYKWESYEGLRNNLQREVNSNTYDKPSFEIYAKTDSEKAELKTAKARFKQFKK